MSDLQRLSAISRVLGWICVALMVFLPVSAVLLWFNFEALGQGMPDRLGIPDEYNVPLALMPVQIALGLAIMMVPIGIMMFGLWHLRQLFVGFDAGRVFTIENTRFLRIFAWSTLAVIVVQFFANGLLAVVLTLSNPPGQRVLAFSLSTEHIIALFVGFVFVVIARVLEEGRKLADDNATIL